MYKTEYSKVIAVISVLILLTSVLSNSVHLVFADSNKETIAKEKQLSEERAKEYLKQLGAESKKDMTKPRYGQFNVTTTGGLGKDRKAEIEKAKQVSDEKAKEILEKLYPKLAQKKYGS